MLRASCVSTGRIWSASAEKWLRSGCIAIDANGNTTSSSGISNTYDFENRMLTHGSVTLVYDGDGNRVSETMGGTTTKYLVDDHNPTGLSQVLDELVGGSVTRTYAYGYQRLSENQLISANWTPSFYGYDGHLNVRFLSSIAASITDSYDYDAFGMPIRTSGTTPNQFLYSGERDDSSIGLYDLRARYYNQATGRFWARDPAKGVSCTPLSFNPYIYTFDEPVDRIDPTGRESVDYALSLNLVTRRTIAGQIVLATALACVTLEDATFFGSVFYNGITGNNPLNITQAGLCALKPDNDCRKQFDEDINYFAEAYPQGSRGRELCIARARQNYENCLAGSPRQPLDPAHPDWTID
jgi:RHS repeat-associated protein